MEMHPNGMTISDNKGNQQSDKMPNYCYAKIIGMDVAIRAFILLVKRSASG